MSTTELIAAELPPPESRSENPRRAQRLGAVLLAAVPGLLTIYLSFNAGGYFAGAQGAVVAVLAIAVALRMAFVRDPFGGFGRPLQIAAGALALFSLWSLLSARWSHAPARALLDFDLANVYLLALVLIGSSARSHRRVRWTVVLTWLAMLGVCVAALAVRLRPDLFPAPTSLSPNRLAFPLTYWNALGLFGVIGITLALHLASSTREPRAMRVLATAAIPVFGVMILLTYSRAAIVLGGIGVLAYALLARPRGLPGALIAAVPTSVFAIAATYQANLISNADTSAAAVQQGRELTTTILISCAAAALGRTALLELDVRLASLMMSSTRRHNARIGLTVGCLVAVVAVGIGFGGQIAHQWSNFTKQDSSLGANDVRNRISNIRIGSRLPGWKVAIHSYDSSELHGHGAGTFAIDWNRQRPNAGVALQAHSIYLEAMAELGWVGLAAIVTFLSVLIAACFVRARRASRSLWVALGVIAVVWALHAGVDWDWEMPAVTLPVVSLAGCALARRGGQKRLPWRINLPLRILVGGVCVAIVVSGALISVSDRYFAQSVAEFNSSNCPAAVADARTAINAVSSRPQPYAIIAYCDVVIGAPRPAVVLMNEALKRDPENWRYWYGLSVALAAGGENPHAAIAYAERLDPLESIVRATAHSFRGSNPRGWERAALSAAMPVSMRE